MTDHRAHVRPAWYQVNGRHARAWEVRCQHCQTVQGPFLDQKLAQAWVDGHDLAVQHIEQRAA